MMAGVIFVAGVTGVLSATATYMNVMEHQRKLAIAWRMLQADAALLRRLPDTASEWTNSTSTGYAPDGSVVPAANASFKIARTFAADTPHTGARRLTLVARWSERAGARTATMVVQR
jgi:Tfp pilus assembly protein PilV